MLGLPIISLKETVQFKEHETAAGHITSSVDTR
jgi:hypothetical protein